MYAKRINSLLHSTILALLFFGKVVSTPAGRKEGSRFDGEIVRTIVDVKNLKNITEKVLKFNQVIVIDVLKLYTGKFSCILFFFV